MGTSVVAYDIPAIRFVYQGLKPVKIIREFDVSSMVKVANRVMRMSDEEYESEHDKKNFWNYTHHGLMLQEKLMNSYHSLFKKLYR